MENQNELQDPIVLLSKINSGNVLTALISFISLWYYIYILIIEETANNASFHKLLSYCAIHFVITAFIFFLLFIYYANARAIVNKNYKILFLTDFRPFKLYYDFGIVSARAILIYWFPILFLCIFILCLVSFDNLFISTASILLVFFILFWISCRKDQEKYGLHMPAIILLTSFSIFLVAIITISQNVIISVDKSSYNKNDSINISLLSKGYMSMPQISHLEISKGREKIPHNIYEGDNHLSINDLIHKNNTNSINLKIIYKLPYFNIFGYKTKRIVINHD